MVDRATGLRIGGFTAFDRIDRGLRVVAGTEPPPAPRSLCSENSAISAVIQPQETAFAARLFGLIPSPRAARRFAGVYRQIKASLAPLTLTQFEGGDGVGGQYQVPMLLLAIRIGAPAAAEHLFPALRDAAAEGEDLVARLSTCSSVAPGLASMAMVEQIVRPIVSDPAFPASSRLFSVWVPRIARYTFDMTGAPRCAWLSAPDRASLEQAHAVPG